MLEALPAAVANSGDPHASGNLLAIGLTPPCPRPRLNTRSVAVAPRNANRRVQTLRELDNDIKYTVPSATVSRVGVMPCQCRGLWLATSTALCVTLSLGLGNGVHCCCCSLSPAASTCLC